MVHQQETMFLQFSPGTAKLEQTRGAERSVCDVCRARLKRRPDLCSLTLANGLCATWAGQGQTSQKWELTKLQSSSLSLRERASRRLQATSIEHSSCRMQMSSWQATSIDNRSCRMRISWNFVHIEMQHLLSEGCCPEQPENAWRHLLP